MEGKKVAELRATDNYHFVFAGFTTFKDALKIMKDNLHFYRFEEGEKKNIKEIFYDNEYNMLSDAGIVLSKSMTTQDTFFNIRRLSRLLNKRNKKYTIDRRCSPTDHPRDYAEHIAAAINDSFSSSLTIDLENIVKKTQEKILIENNKTIYNVICGSGYRAKLVEEHLLFKDIKTGKKVFQEAVCLSVPSGEYPETAELLKFIERNISGLVLFKESRFEIAQRLLYSQEEEE